MTCGDPLFIPNDGVPVYAIIAPPYAAYGSPYAAYARWFWREGKGQIMIFEI
jgi:hypothetical protein